MTRDEVRELVLQAFAKTAPDVRDLDGHFEVRMTFRIAVPVNETMDLEMIEARITNARYSACFSIEHDLGVPSDLEKLVDMTNAKK